MKCRKIFISVLLLTFFLGITAYFLIPKLENQFERKEIAEVISQERLRSKVEFKGDSEIFDENIQWREEDDNKFQMKLLEIGEYHGTDVEEKSSKNWIGLFKEKNKYFLRKTDVKIHLVRDEMVDGSEEKTGKSVSVKSKNKPRLLLQNAAMLQEGKINTLFYANSIDEEISLQNGFVKTYNINGKKYTLRVEGGNNSSKLILKNGNTEQVLTYVDAMGDATWSLFWVGDLDGDGKLDLYADLTDFYNMVERKLFLSSQAEEGKLVKQVAVFATIGC